MHNPLDMLIFAKVVELHSFSAAAQSLGISRSAVSKHVTRLEHSLGARLLNRSTRKLSLTEAGHSAYGHCARIATEVAASELSVLPFVSKPQGRLRISAPGAFGRQHLVPILPDYLALHPDVSIELIMSDRLVDLVQEQFDVAISSSPLLQANLVGRVLAPLVFTICASPQYIARCGVPSEPQDLTRHCCIYYTSSVVRGDVWRVTRGSDVLSMNVGGRFRANNSEAVRDAAVKGLGIALLPTFAVSQEIVSGRLVPLLPGWVPMGTLGPSLMAYFIADRHLAPKIRTLVDFMVERFGRVPYWDRNLNRTLETAS